MRECTRQNWKRARDAGSAIIDLSGALEEEDGATVRSMWVERERGQVWQPDLQPAPCIVAHPAALTLAFCCCARRKLAHIRSAAATVFQPASEQGQKGMDELHQQTINLLSFQNLPKDVFDTQVAFNMVARYGPNSKLSLDSLEARSAPPLSKDCRGGRLAACADGVAASGFSWPCSRHIFWRWRRLSIEEELVQALAGDHVTVAGTEERVAAQQREHCRAGKHFGFAEAGGIAAERNLVVGRHRQFAGRGHHGSGMRRKHDPHPPSGEDPMKWAHVLVPGAILRPSPVADITRLAIMFTLPENVKTIAVPAFTNATTTYRIEQTLTASWFVNLLPALTTTFLTTPAKRPTLRFAEPCSPPPPRRSLITPRPGKLPAFWWW